ncbi:MAG TPA: tetratricopeptide repeat protein [Gemmatimonadales bacterium]|nr:tetratricopeptide repeat protein [Gemmatimonadales bacterium]
MRAGPLALALLASPALVIAQLPDADAAFRRGDYVAARTAYERVLATDSLNIRAIYQLAILDSWDGKLSRSLQRLTRARRLEPLDADIMLSQAQVLAWAGEVRAAEALYDSVLARSPDRSDALAGRARAIAWSGDLDRAEQLWRSALERHPDSAELLIGLAQTLYWKGQPQLAESYAVRARALAPEDRTARDLERDLRAALRPEVSTKTDGASDSDGNEFVAQDATITTSVSQGIRGTAQVGWRRATDPVGDGSSYGAGGYGIGALGRGAVLRAGLGVRRVEPDITRPRTWLTAQFGLGLRPGRYTALSVAYGRAPFDETAGLMRLNLIVNALDLNVDLSPKPGWSMVGGIGGAWLSDSNRRYSAVGAVLGRVARGLQIGPYAKVLGYHEPRVGVYFAPSRFSTFEGRAVYQWQSGRWGVRADGGLGTQQIKFNLQPAQNETEWHLGASVSRGWGANNELALVGSITNSAGATTTVGVPGESFRYKTLGLRFRQGL